MMQAPEPGHRYDPETCIGICRGDSTLGRLLLQCEVCPVVVVITDVLTHQAFQMGLVEHDHMIEQISSTVANPAFGDAVLPGTLEAGPFGRNAKALHRADDFLIEVRAAIKDQVSGNRITREGLAKLLHDPRAGGMLGHIAMENPFPVMRDDEKAIKHAEGERRHGKEVHCRNGFMVIVQECCPSLCRFRVSRRFAHPAQNGSLRNVEAEHLQFTVDTWRTPRSVLGHHAKD